MLIDLLAAAGVFAAAFVFVDAGDWATAMTNENLRKLAELILVDNVDERRAHDYNANVLAKEVLRLLDDYESCSAQRRQLIKENTELTAECDRWDAVVSRMHGVIQSLKEQKEHE